MSACVDARSALSAASTIVPPPANVCAHRVLAAHSAEVAQVVQVGRWALSQLPPRPLVLLGASAGAPIAGSALEQLPSAAGYVGIGYTWGWLAAVGFGRHFGAIQRSATPK
eukprot:6178940-Pleurochrysis_carterae.AAC.2